MGTDTVKVSIIIPAHNEEQRIADTIRSALEQDHPHVEIIVIDNASTDSTQQIAKSFPVKVVAETRKGVMRACERGRCEAAGDIIVRLDADCIPDPTWIKRALSHFEDDSVVAVSGPYDYHDGDPLLRNSSLFAQKYIYRITNQLLRVFGKGGVMVGGNSFFRSKALEEIGGFNTDIVFYGDEIDTSKRIAKTGIIVYDPHLIVKTSARRFKSEGSLNLIRKYWYHFFKGIFSKTE